MNYVIGGTLATIAGTNIINTLVCGTIGTIYNSILFIKNGSYVDDNIHIIKRNIDSLDINIKIETLKSIMETEESKPINTDNNIVCRTNINNELHNKLIVCNRALIDQINKKLTCIELEIALHNAKWFRGYRTLSLNEHFEELNGFVCILTGRIQLMLNIYNYENNHINIA